MKKIFVLLLFFCGLSHGDNVHYAVCANKADAETVSKKIDTANGYPRIGVNIGSGIHVPAELGVTSKYYGILECEDGSFLVEVPSKDVNLVGVEYKVFDAIPKMTVKTIKAISAGFTTIESELSKIQANEVQIVAEEIQ